MKYYNKTKIDIYVYIFRFLDFDCQDYFLCHAEFPSYWTLYFIPIPFGGFSLQLVIHNR